MRTHFLHKLRVVRFIGRAISSTIRIRERSGLTAHSHASELHSVDTSFFTIFFNYRYPGNIFTVTKMYFAWCVALFFLSTGFEHIVPGVYSREVDIFFNEENVHQPGCCHHQLNDDELLTEELLRKDEFSSPEQRIRRELLRQSDEISSPDACLLSELRRRGANDLSSSDLRSHRDILRKNDLSLAELRLLQRELRREAADLSTVNVRTKLEKLCPLLDVSSPSDVRDVKVLGRSQTTVIKRQVEEEDAEEEEETEQPKKSQKKSLKKSQKKQSQKKQKAEAKKKPAKSSKSSKSKGKSSAKKGKKDKKQR